MKFTAEEAYEDRSIKMTRGAALKALKSHGLEVAEFDAEVPVADVYVAWDVLGWMGY